MQFPDKEELEKNFRNKASDLRSDAAYYATKPFVSAKEKEKATEKEKMMWAALAGIAGFAASLKTTKNLIKPRWPLAVLTGASSAATGYFAPDIVDSIRREKAGKQSSIDTKNQIRDFGRKELAVYDETKRVIRPLTEIKKEAFLSGALKVTKGILKPVRMAAATPIGRKSIAGGAIAGAGYGGYRLHKNLTAPRSGRNYTTLLRNNILAGKINPDELVNEDLKSVRNLGMR